MRGTFETEKSDMKKRDNLKSIDCTGHSIRIVSVLNRCVMRQCTEFHF